MKSKKNTNKKPKRIVKTKTGMAKNARVEKTKSGWKVVTTGSKKALKTTATQKQAIKIATRYAKKNNSKVKVKSKKGVNRKVHSFKK